MRKTMPYDSYFFDSGEFDSEVYLSTNDFDPSADHGYTEDGDEVVSADQDWVASPRTASKYWGSL
jgi:hypothetical protein